MTEPSAVIEGAGNAGDPSGTTGDSAATPEMIPVSDLNAYKSATDKQIAALQNELGTYATARREEALAAIEDPKDRESAELKMQIEDLRAKYEAADAISQKSEALKRISNVSGVPVEALSTAVDETSAWELAVRYKSDNTSAGKPTTPVLGQAKGSSERDFVKEITEAKAAGDYHLVSSLAGEARAALSKG